MQEELVCDLWQQRYDKANDQHVFAIDRLVQELGMPAEEVNRSYREILEELKQNVSAGAFLPALVSMGVIKRLSGSGPA